MATYVDIPDISDTVWTNRLDLITCKMTVWTASPRSDLKTNWVQCDQSQRSQDVGRDGDEDFQ